MLYLTYDFHTLGIWNHHAILVRYQYIRFNFAENLYSYACKANVDPDNGIKRYVVISFTGPNVHNWSMLVSETDISYGWLVAVLPANQRPVLKIIIDRMGFNTGIPQ